MSRSRFVLGIDTASRLGSIALAENGSASAWETLAPGAHSSGLSQAGAQILSQRNLRWSDLAGIAVSSGPGSFTGLRIGLAWAKGVCTGSGIKLALVSEHEACAHLHRREGGLIATVLAGERGYAQAALWSARDPLELLWGPEAVPEMEVVDKISRAPAVVTGAGLEEKAVGMIRDAGFRVLGPGDTPTGAAVAELGDRYLLGGRNEDLVLSAPSYGRAPNARKPPS